MRSPWSCRLQRVSTRSSSMRRGCARRREKISTQQDASSSTGTVAWDAELALSWERFEDPVHSHGPRGEGPGLNHLNLLRQPPSQPRHGRLRLPMRRGEMARKPQRRLLRAAACVRRGECASTKVAFVWALGFSCNVVMSSRTWV